jgi:hypothetical protein
MRPGAWIFVSHSIRDIDRVRRVRNTLEDLGHFPLLFYLHSMSDDSEIDSLIKREIQARTFFLLCDSPNARESRWVQHEVAYIKGQPGKFVMQLQLDDPWETQLQTIEAVSRRSSVYLSYKGEDYADVQAIGNGLKRADYAVFGLERFHDFESDWQGRSEQDIDEAIRHGFFLCFLTPARLTQEEGYHWWEWRYALKVLTRFPPGHGPIIPITLHDHNETVRLIPKEFTGVQCLDLSRVPSQDRANALLTYLGERPQ